jgi:hypothetical protein
MQASHRPNIVFTAGVAKKDGACIGYIFVLAPDGAAGPAAEVVYHTKEPVELSVWDTLTAGVGSQIIGMGSGDIWARGGLVGFDTINADADDPAEGEAQAKIVVSVGVCREAFARAEWRSHVEDWLRSDESVTALSLLQKRERLNDLEDRDLPKACQWIQEARETEDLLERLLSKTKIERVQAEFNRGRIRAEIADLTKEISLLSGS